MLCLFVLACSTAMAQPSQFVGVPRAGGSLLELSLQGLELAKELGFKGVAVEVGPGEDPLNIDLTNTKRLAHAAASLQLRLNCSMGHPPINERWRKVNGGEAWPSKARFPETLWPYVAKDMSARVEAVADVYRHYGLDPTQWITWEPFNEVGWQGIGGAHNGNLSDRKWEPKYDRFADPNGDGDRKDALDGLIEREQFERMVYIYENVDWRGMGVGTPTLEGQQGASQRREIDSFDQNADLARRIVARCTFVGFNCYAPRAGNPEAMANGFVRKVRDQIDLIRTSTVLRGLPFVLQEYNVFVDRVPPNGDAGEFRMAVVRAARSIGELQRVTAFTLYSTNNATSDVAFYDRENRPIPAGSRRVEAAP